MNNLLRYLSYNEYEMIKNEEDLYRKSYNLVMWLFKDKKDKNNELYIGHLLRVASKMKGVEGKVVALLHDLVEDVEYVTFLDLINIGIPGNVIEALKLVTKQPHRNDLSEEEKIHLYNTEIDNIINSNNSLAIALKYADMSDNFNKDRLSKLDEATKSWLNKKYSENIKKLEKRMENINDRYKIN